MDCFGKCYTTHDGDTYVYDHVPAKADKVTFLLIHGYPSSRHDWRYQISDLTEAGYGVIAPDCLGYGASDKRLDIEAYRLKRLSRHFEELLDHENIQQVVGVAHDWGSMLMSRVVVWHPERFLKLVFVSAGYTAPGIFFDVDGLNVLSQTHLGYMQLGYWYFFNSYDAADVINKHVCYTVFSNEGKAQKTNAFLARVLFPRGIPRQERELGWQPRGNQWHALLVDQ